MPPKLRTLNYGDALVHLVHFKPPGVLIKYYVLMNDINEDINEGKFSCVLKFKDAGVIVKCDTHYKMSK